MPRRRTDRDPFERLWERIATIDGALRALMQPDVSAIADLLRATAESFSTGRFRIPPQRLTGVAVNLAKPDNCAKSAANNLEQLSKELRDIVALPDADRVAVERAIQNLVPLVESAEIKLSTSWDYGERLRLARKTFLLNVR